ncbi:sensor histidine kinase [Nesterenkonia lutea]|uniref:histidine kinase n=1 Tax=Nesterenkonia lutea TaxID=272919 RepID=A0ABR9JDG1_9MICC|nr:ATP-binding protein [Nesterenkonia lutea]MBE1523975.1 two-component system OmpR family sensor kinase [Nesterenkonia lutea]
MSERLSTLIRVSEWPLRRQLAASIVVLLILAVVIIGSVSVSMQRQSLLDRLDDQLRVSLDISTNNLGEAQSQGVFGGPEQGPGPQGPPEEPEGFSPDDLGPGPQRGTVTLVILDEEAQVAQLVEEGSGAVVELSPEQISALDAAGGTAEDPVEVDLEEQGSYRVATEQVLTDGAEATVIVGESLAEVHQTVRDQVLIFSLVALATIALALVGALMLIRLGLRPLDRLASAATRVAQTPLSSGTVQLSERLPAADTRAHTETGQVGAAFNTMLDHVESSLHVRQEGEERLRRFVADASHELRTPLASVSGYAELASRVRQPLPETVERSLQRIGSESARMAVMVEDLLLLARLDSGAPLRRETVALAGVVVDACADAQVIGPDHRWVMELEEDAAEILVDGDGHRLHQVMTNLLTNARTHTSAGTTVTVRLGTSGDAHAVIQVEDDGPGIPEQLQERLFDRFVRGDGSRSRTAGSTGLGMSIVQAIVEAHSGRVDVDSVPGRTLFTVKIPLRNEPSPR